MPNILENLELGICDEGTSLKFNSQIKEVSWTEALRRFRGMGWNFIECAPWAPEVPLWELPADALLQRSVEARNMGIPIHVLHWLMFGTQHKTTVPEADVRARAAEFLRDLARVAKNMGVTGMVYGSPPSRTVFVSGGNERGAVTEQHYDWFAEVIRSVINDFDAAGVNFWFEFLSDKETNFGNTPEDALRISGKVNHPRCRQIHLDVKAALALNNDVEAVATMIRKLGDKIGHVHINDVGGSVPGHGSIGWEPGTGERTNFVPIFKALGDINYPGRVSMECFNFLPKHPDGPMANPWPFYEGSLRYTRRAIEIALAG